MCIDVPKPAGYIALWNGFHVGAKTKPNVIHLFFMRLIFGWKWFKSVS
jgi:hypothetical protein